MLGTEFANNLPLLRRSLGEMRDEYQQMIAGQRDSKLRQSLESAYVRLFGIPEVGFQLRHQYFRQILTRHLNNRAPRQILDAGSGIGASIFALAAQFPAANVVGYEIDRTKMEACSDVAESLGLENVRLIRRDLSERGEYGSTFDLIINIDVLEHINDYSVALDNLVALLNVGGNLYIHTPQPGQRRFFRSLITWEHRDHIREGFNPRSLCNELVARGLRIIECRETFGLLGRLAWELNHIALARSFPVAAISFPLLYLIAGLDLAIPHRHGLGTAVIAVKE